MTLDFIDVVGPVRGGSNRDSTATTTYLEFDNQYGRSTMAVTVTVIMRLFAS